MFRSRALFLLMGVFAVSLSCIKKGPTKACFSISKSNAKISDTLYLLNCSENYSKYIWYSPIGFFPSGSVVDSLGRHQQLVVTSAGKLKIKLRVGEIGQFFSNSTSGYMEIEKEITVNP